MDLTSILIDPKPSFYILYCPSDLLYYFLERRLSKIRNVQRDNIIEVNSTRKLNSTSETNRLKPIISDAWIYKVSDKANLSREHNKLARANRFGYYLYREIDYKSYLKHTKLFKDNQKVSLISLSYLNKESMKFLYNELVEKDINSNKLNSKCYQFLEKNYGGDVEKVLTLFYELKRKVEIKTNNDIVKLIGISSRTLDNYMFHLLKTPTYTEKGLRNYIKRALQDSSELCKHYTYKGLQTILINNIKTCIEIKHLFRTNKLNYSRVLDIDSSYNLTKIKKYKRWYKHINEIPLSRYIGLLTYLSSKPIYSELDWTTFIYNYIVYKSKCQPEDLRNGIKKQEEIDEKKRQRKLKKEKEALTNSGIKPKKESKKKPKKEKDFDEIMDDLVEYKQLQETIANILN